MSERTPKNWHAEHNAHLTRGQRAADIMRNGMGSWPFVGGFLLFMIVWAIINSTTARWDPYPFILLNLFLSMLAGLQGAILLIAAKRQDGLAGALAQHDYDTNVRAKRDIESLLAINKTQLLMIEELHEIICRLDATAPTSLKAGAKKR
ncbi:MAG: DUF1003 domain-containing protein [Rhodoglobus sp.]